MPVINGVYLKDFPALPSSVADANIIPIAISGNQIAYRTTVAGIVTDARVTSKLLTGLSVTGSTILATDTILQAFGKVQNQLNGKVSSVGLTMPAAFNVANSPITSAGTLAVTAAGLASQYIRGDGALADFPTTGGGGSSVSYYLNGSVSQGTIGGNAYYEMNKTPVIGTGTDFSIAADGYIAQFITDANDPGSLLIPGGNWNVEMYFSASSSGGTPSFYVEVYKYNGTTFTLLGSSATTPEGITNGTAIDIYYTSVGIPETVLTITDRLAIRVYVTHSGRTITLHTEDNHLSEIVTTFSNGLTALNGLTKQVQFFAVGTTGTDFNISSSVDTHTFNIPSASATARGLITTGTQTIAGAKTLTGALVGTTANFTGQLTLGSTITNGTYTYTLPSATGTLALTSDIHSAVTLSAIGSTPNANGATLTGQVLNLQPADASFGGVVTTGTQTFAGAKTFNNGISASTTSGNTIASTCSATGGLAFYGQSSGGIGAQFESGASGEAALIAKHTNSGPLQYWMTSSGVVATMSNAGALTIAGQLSLGSTITNGTYTYTLPSATGTLALTSALSSYLPLSGGTLTGALSGTSATFSGALATSAGAAINSGNGALAIAASSTRGIINIAGSTDQFLTFSSQSYIYNSSSLFRLLSSSDIDFVAGGSQRLLISASTGAATFSSSVTATTGLTVGSLGSGSDAIITLANNASGAPRTIYYKASNASVNFTSTGAADLMMLSNGGVLTINNLGTGTVQATAGVLSVISDSKAKDKTGLFDGSALNAINKIEKPQYWNYNAKSELGESTYSVKQFGLFADDIHEVLGEEFAPTQTQSVYNEETKETKVEPILIDGSISYSMSDRALLSLAIQAIQELKAEIDLLKGEPIIPTDNNLE